MNQVHVGRAVLAGLVATTVMTVMMAVAPVMGFPRMDIAVMLGTMFVSNPQAALVPGMIMHFFIGTILAFVYAAVHDRLPGPGWERGAVFGMLPFVVAAVMVMPMMGAIHPLVRSGAMAAPGFLMLGMGHLAPLGSLMGHLVYGAILGTIYETRQSAKAAMGRG